MVAPTDTVPTDGSNRSPLAAWRSQGWLSVALLAGAVYAACFLFADRPDGAELRWLDLWFHNGLRLLCGAVAWAGARRRGADRAGWMVAAGAVTLNGIANFAWVLLFDSAALSPADALFLAFYPLMYVAVVLLARSRAATKGWSQWLDGGVAGFGVAALVAAFVFPPLLTGASGGALTVAVNLSYPLADLLLIAVLLAGLAPAGWRPDRPLGVLIAGLLLNTVGDTVYLLESAADAYQASSMANLAWIVGFVLVAIAPSVGSARTPKTAATGSSRLLLPAGAAIAAFVLVLVSSERPVLRVAVGLAATTLVFAGVRVGLAFRELRLLANSRREARTDELTGLPNRRAFLEAVEEDLRRLTEGRPFSVLLMDLDGFKEINDTLGHHSGDQLLAAVGQVVRQHLRPTDLVARLGGDEYAIVLENTDLAQAQHAAEALRRAVNVPFQVAGMAISVGASIGISNAPVHAADTSTLLRFADIAMYQAKQQRCGVRVYETLGDHRQRDRLELAQEIRQALLDGQIVLHYQPKVEILTGQVRGTEALARWRHPTRGLLYPDVFLPLVEQADLGHDFTRCVLTVAVQQLARWQRAGVTWTVAVNIAPADLLDVGLPEFVGELLCAHGVPPQRLVLEITEGALVADPERAARTVRRLRAAGTQISLDDFGVGFSSLVHLRTMEFDELKLDRTLAVDLEDDRKGQAIVRGAVGLASALGLRLVVEGVETPDERDLIAALGARYIQGYVYSKPLAASALEAWARDGIEPAVLRRLSSTDPTSVEGCPAAPIAAAPADRSR